jgi:hypothetical protein
MEAVIVWERQIAACILNRIEAFCGSWDRTASSMDITLFIKLSILYV